jgi:hypothetical protein
MHDLPDVDLEVLNRDEVVKLFPEARIASQLQDGRMVRHKNGIYFQDIPVNDLNGLAAFPYDIAEALGFYKVDLLSAPEGPYGGLESQEQLTAYLDSPIEWKWFEDAAFVHGLFHLNGVVYLGHERVDMSEIVAYYKPQSIADLAIMVAVKMPAKKYLIGEPWEGLRGGIWLPEPPEAGARFKKSHATAYALAVGVQARRQKQQRFHDDLDTV